MSGLQVTFGVLMWAIGLVCGLIFEMLLTNRKSTTRRER